MPANPSRRRRPFAPRALASVGLAAALLVGPGGCSLFVPADQAVTVQASDPSARLFVDGRPVGVGTANVAVRRNRNHTFRAETTDGRIQTGRLYREVSTTGILDVIGGVFFLVPFLGVIGPGFWTLDQDHVYLALPPAPGDRPAADPGR